MQLLYQCAKLPALVAFGSAFSFSYPRDLPRQVFGFDITADRQLLIFYCLLVRAHPDISVQHGAIGQKIKLLHLYPFVELNATDFTTIIGIATAYSFCAVLTFVFVEQFI